LLQNVEESLTEFDRTRVFARGGAIAQRSQTAQVHNLSERGSDASKNKRTPIIGKLYILKKHGLHYDFIKLLIAF
jgi:hypothetical protein